MDKSADFNKLKTRRDQPTHDVPLGEDLDTSTDSPAIPEDAKNQPFVYNNKMKSTKPWYSNNSPLWWMRVVEALLIAIFVVLGVCLFSSIRDVHTLTVKIEEKTNNVMTTVQAVNNRIDNMLDKTNNNYEGIQIGEIKTQIVLMKEKIQDILELLKTNR